MLVRTFTAEDMPEALKKVKQTLGPDALILSTRTLRKKGLGLLGKPQIEVTAAIESPAMKSLEAPAPKPQKKVKTAAKAAAAYQSATTETKPRRESASQPVIDPLEMEINQLRQQVAEQNVGDLQRELGELKAMIQRFAEARTESPEPTPAAPVLPVAEPSPSPRKTPASPCFELLSRCGIEREAAETIARFAESRMSEEQRRDPLLQREFLRDTIADLVQVSNPAWQKGEQGQRRVALIGPTGVGKTTTIAKLAAAAIDAGARVALVTIDTYRIAAVEQLKVYGEIMNLPVEVIFRPEQLPLVFDQHRDKDLILIDTAGRSPRDRSRIDELADFLGADSGVENWLVLSAHTRDEQLIQVVENFSRVPVASLAFTKLDECDSWGTLLNLPTRAGLPLACLTNGQQVPEDLLAAEPLLVAEWVLGSEPQTQKDVV